MTFRTAFLLATLATLPPALAAQQPRPEGRWELLVSEDTLPPVRPLGPPTAGPVAGMPGGGARGPGGPPGGEMPAGRTPGGRYQRDYSEKDLLRMRQTLRLGHRAPARVEILRREKLLVLTDTAGGEQRLPIGRTTETTAADSAGSVGQVETSVKWKGDALVVEHRVDGGGRVRETYGVGLDGSRMVVFVEIRTGALPTSFRRQYRKVE